MGRTLAPRYQQPVLLALAGCMLAVASVLPLASLAGELSHGDALAHAARALAVGHTWRLFAGSLGFAAAVTALALLAGVPLGLILGRSDLPGRRLALGLHAFPVFLPPFLLALGWFHLLGRSGLLGSEATARLLFSPIGAVLVLALGLTPIVTALVAVALQAVDPSLEEAALLAGGPWRTATLILVPLVRPAVALGALVVFALAFSELGVPSFLRVNLYPGMVFSRLGGVDYAPGEAFALALPLFAVALLLLALERAAVGRRSFAVLGVRSREVPALRLGRWRAAAALLAWSGAIVPLAPLAALAIRAAGGRGFSGLSRSLGSSVGNSLTASISAAGAILVLAMVIGHAAARGHRAALALDAVAVLAFLTPASVLGVGLIATWNRSATQVIYGSGAIVALAFAARYAAIGLRTAAVSFAQGSLHLEEAAAVCGAGFIRRLTRILVPMHAGGLAAAFLLALVFCLRDLETAVLLYPAGGEPLTVRIFTLEANGAEAVVAALSCVQVAVTAAVLLAGAALLFGRRRS